MCRYAFKYKDHDICLSCRKQFRTTDHFNDVDGRKCPECAILMVRVGKDFKPPRRQNRQQWKKVALLIERGERFDSCGCTGPGYVPTTYSEAKWTT